MDDKNECEYTITPEGTRDKIASMMEDLDVVDYCDSFQNPQFPEMSSTVITFKDGTRIKVDVSSVKNFDDNHRYVCDTAVKCPRYFRCTFSGRDLNAGVNARPDDCPADRISLIDDGYDTNKADEAVEDYRYLVCGSYEVKEEAYAYKSLRDAKTKLKSLRNTDCYVWEKKEKPVVGGMAFIKKFEFDGDNIVEVELETGLHIKWLLERKTLVRNDKK